MIAPHGLHALAGVTALGLATSLCSGELSARENAPRGNVPVAGSVSDTRQEPGNARALAAKGPNQVSAEALRADRERKRRMSPEERAWEEVLEANLGSFYLPRYKEAKAKGRETAWDHVQDDPALPRVLLIGDSISRGYTVPARHALAGKVNLHRAPANCGPTATGLRRLDVWLGSGTWDLIHFNFGIHDQRTAPEVYAERLEKIVARLEETGAKLVWASSTPLPEGSDKYRAGACKKLNAVAAEIMRRHGIPINDLYTTMLPVVGEYQNPGDCHFQAAGYAYLGGFVATRILEELGLK